MKTYYNWQVESYVEVNLIELKQIGDTEFIDATTLKLKKENKTKKVFGKMTFKQFFDNTHFIEATTYKQQGGEYRLMPYKLHPQPFCDFLSSMLNKPY